jgi:hypothetical protein
MIEDPEQPLSEIEGISVKTDGRVKALRPYSKLPFDLNVDDLASGGVHKMLLGEIERLSEENGRLQALETQFHEKDKRCAVLVAESKQNTLLEILYTIAIAVGAALLGWIPNSASTYGTVVVVVLASVLFIFALFAKWKPK